MSMLFAETLRRLRRERGLSQRELAERLFVTEHAVARNISAIFDEFGLPPSVDDHRRVLAVIRYLDRDLPDRPDQPDRPDRPTPA
jgi:transcriptional regulator with XRE-family HTH domain